MQETKRCSKCREFKPFTEFGKHKAWRDGYFPQCRACKRLSDKASYAKHRSERSVTAKQRYVADPQTFKDRSRKRYRDNPEAWAADVKKWQAANIEKKRGYGAAWTKRNLAGAVRENTRRRYARRKGAKTIKFTKAQLEQRMAYYGNRCWICKGPREAIDHVKPLTKGGAHMLCNLRPICNSCNSRKRNTWPFAI